MSKFVNTLSQSFWVIALFFSLNSNLSADEIIERTQEGSKARASITKPNLEDSGRKIQTIQIPDLKLNFQFSNFTTKWFFSQNEWKKFWQNHSRSKETAPAINVDWSSEQVLAIFWEGKDSWVKNPSFAGVQIQDDHDIREMKLYFNLNYPCFGIYTDVSPVQFLVLDKNVIDIDRFVISTENTRSMNCY